MTTGVLLIYLLLFSLGCGGAVSLGIFYKCLGNSVLKNFLFVFIVLLFSLLRSMVWAFNLITEHSFLFQKWVSLFLSFTVVLALYFFLFLLLLDLKGMNFHKAFYPTLTVILVQVSRTILYMVNPDRAEALYLPFMVFISAYIFYVGSALLNGSKDGWHYSLQKLLKGLGRITVIFSLASLIFYLIWFYLGFRNKQAISLDFLFLSLWSLISIITLLNYLARVGHLPDNRFPDKEIIENYGFTQRETEVLVELMKGMTNKEIGEVLFISPVTVRTHMSRLFEKAEVRNRVELVAKMTRA